MLSIKVNKLYLSWGSSFRPSLTVWHLLELWSFECISLRICEERCWQNFHHYSTRGFHFGLTLLIFIDIPVLLWSKVNIFPHLIVGWVQKMFVSHFVRGNVRNIFFRRWRMTRELFIQAFVLFRQLSYGAIKGRRQTDRWSRIMFVKFSFRIREFWFSSVGPFKTSHCNPSIKWRKCLQFL